MQNFLRTFIHAEEVFLFLMGSGGFTCGLYGRDFRSGLPLSGTGYRHIAHLSRHLLFSIRRPGRVLNRSGLRRTLQAACLGLYLSIATGTGHGIGLRPLRQPELRVLLRQVGLLPGGQEAAAILAHTAVEVPGNAATYLAYSCVLGESRRSLYGSSGFISKKICYFFNEQFNQFCQIPESLLFTAMLAESAGRMIQFMTGTAFPGYRLASKNVHTIYPFSVLCIMFFWCNQSFFLLFGKNQIFFHAFTAASPLLRISRMHAPISLIITMDSLVALKGNTMPVRPKVLPLRFTPESSAGAEL